MASITPSPERRAQIEQVAGIIRELIAIDGAYGPPVFDREKLAELNRDGWTIERSAPLGHWLREEGVVLSAAELRAAIDTAARPD